MTYDAREASVQSGAPVELFEFARGSLVFRYTSADADFEFGGETFVAAPLQRGKLETSSERARNALTIQCARDFEIADFYRVAPPTDIVSLIVRRVHRDDAGVAVIWHGRVLNCDWQGSVASLRCEPVTSSLRRPGLRRSYQRGCPHVLYQQGDGMCNVVRATHSTVTTVAAVSGLTLTVAALGAKPFAGGFVEWEVASGVIERRFIVSFSGLVLTLSQAFQGIAIADAVTVSPGCDHTQATCNGTYANGPNYGGFPFIPIINPFAGTPVY